MNLLTVLMICCHAAILPPTEVIQDTIHASHENHLDLTSDGVPERLLVTAFGDEWTNLQVRFEIRSTEDELLFTHEWNSKAWFGNIYYPKSDEDAEERGRLYVKNVVDSSRVEPGLLGRIRTTEFLTRFGIRRDLKLDIAEQLWREEHKTPLHQHLIMTNEGWDIAKQYEAMIPEERINNLIEELKDGPSYRLHPHWDASYAVAWSKSEQRFVIAFFIG